MEVIIALRDCIDERAKITSAILEIDRYTIKGCQLIVGFQHRKIKSGCPEEGSSRAP